MKEQRKHPRFPAALNAKYSINGTGKKRTCKITDINRDGVKVEIKTSEKILPGTDISLSIKVPTALSSIRPAATVLWVQQMLDENRTNFIIGCQFSSIKPKDQWCLLDYAYDN